MKLKSRLMLCTAAFALSSTIAQAAIDPNALASTYLADDYSYVEVKTGPTQTKVEAVKGSLVVEVVYDNVTGAILKSETGAVEDDYVGRVGIEIETVDEDFEDEDDIEDDLEDIEDDIDDNIESESESESEGESEGEGEGGGHGGGEGGEGEGEGN